MVKTLQTVSKFTLTGNLKQLLLMLVLSVFIISANAQSNERKWNVGLIGGISLYSGDLGDNITNFNSEVFNQNWVGGFTFSRYINKSFDATLMGTYGT